MTKCWRGGEASRAGVNASTVLRGYPVERQEFDVNIASFFNRRLSQLQHAIELGFSPGQVCSLRADALTNRIPDGRRIVVMTYFRLIDRFSRQSSQHRVRRLDLYSRVPPCGCRGSFWTHIGIPCGVGDVTKLGLQVFKRWGPLIV